MRKNEIAKMIENNNGFAIGLICFRIFRNSLKWKFDIPYSLIEGITPLVV